MRRICTDYGVSKESKVGWHHGLTIVPTAVFAVGFLIKKEGLR